MRRGEEGVGETVGEGFEKGDGGVRERAAKSVLEGNGGEEIGEVGWVGGGGERE